MRTDCHSSELGARDLTDRREPNPISGASSVAAAANNLAWLYAGRGGDLGMALALASVAAERGRDQADADHTLGWVYYRNGLPSLAIAAFRRSVEKDPTNPIYFRHLALAYVKAGDWASSKHCLEQAARLRPWL
jgi:tetratricopeptide (TPR) repeat protein